MDPITNPYAPGAGTRPYELVGREVLLAAFDVAVQRSQIRLPARSMVLYGLRGVGKTVLLNEFSRTAGERRWITIDVEAQAGESLVPALTRAIFNSLREAGGAWSAEALSWARRVFKAFSIKADPGTGSYSFGLDIEPARGYADSGDLERDMPEMLTELATLAGHHGTGVLLTIDEMQEADDQVLRALNTTVHRLGQGVEPRPFLFVGAGLPSLRRIVAEATSYAERLFDYRHIDRLDEPAIRLALERPAAALGVAWDGAAMAEAVEFSRGYPYFVQVFAAHAWDVAAGSRIALSDAEMAAHRARQELDVGLYATRWQRATRAEQRFMQAMADLATDGPVGMSELAVAMGRAKVSQLSPARNQLISKGLVYTPDRGEVAFTVPGMSDFVARQAVR